MKKHIALILVFMLTISLLGGCGSKSTAKDVDPVKTADEMLAIFSPQGELEPVGESVVSNYYDIDPAVVKDYKIYISPSFIAEEIAVFRLVDDKQTTIDAAKAMAEKRLGDLKTTFDGYLPEELASLEENAEIYANGTTVCFVTGAAESKEAALKILKAACEG